MGCTPYGAVMLLGFVGGVTCHAQVTYSEQAQNLGIFHTFDGTYNDGAGPSFCDFDGDGWDDLTIGTGLGNQLAFYKNTGGSFTALPPPVDNSQEVKQVLWVDFDNDGDKDLFACAYLGINRLYRNNGNFTFQDITAQAGLRLDQMRTYGASWGDYDRDGWLDLITTAYSLGYGDTFTNYLYRNLGDGTFEDVTLQAGVEDTVTFTFLPVFLDYDNDNWPDIYTIVDRWMPNAMFHNNGNGTFTNTATPTGTGIPPVDAMSGAVGDFDNNGYQDIYVTNTASGNKLLKNNGNNTFSEVAASAGVTVNGQCWGAQFFDADNDMDEDLYVSADWIVPIYNNSTFFRNNGNGTFTEPSGIGFDSDTLRSFGNAVGDINNDGYPDMAVVNQSPDSFTLWKCSGGTNKWLRFALRGTQSNRDAIGARIEVWVNGIRQVRMIHCGLGYLGQNTFRPTVGLGSHSAADSIKVIWPSGHIDRLFNVSANQTVLIRESVKTTFTDITGWQATPHTYDTTYSNLGGGVSWVDFDQDGLDDLTLATGQGQPTCFYRSLGDSLEKVSLLPANSDTAEKKNILWGDYDNDGDLDVYISTFLGTNKLFRNNGATFVDVTTFSLPQQGTMVTTGACWLDYNLDGDLDLYVINRSSPPFMNLRNYLYENNGNGTFTDVSYPAGVADSANMPQGVAAIDYNKDLWPDLYIAMDKYFGNKLFRNNGNGTFTDVSTQTGSGFEMEGMCVAQGDADNDGDLDLYVTNTPTDGNIFFRSNGNGAFDTIQNGTGVHKVGWGGDFVDYDNDGHLDIFTVNSWNANDNNLRDFLLRNRGDMTYDDMTGVVVDNDTVGFGFGAAYGDLNNDGFPDLAVNNEFNTPSRIYLNNGTWNNWLKLKLQGTVSNRDAVGTWLRLVCGSDTYYRYTNAGISYISQNSFTEMIGVGDHTWVDTVEISWPNGHVDVLTGLPVNQTHVLVEGMSVPVVPQPVILGSPPFCSGDVVMLDAGIWESYLWSTGETTRYTSVTAGGTYSVTVTNVFGFSGSGSVYVTIHPNPVIAFILTPVQCYGSSTGSLQTAITGGPPPYLYNWSTGETTPDISGIPAGTYSVTVTDALGCQSSKVVTLPQPPPLTLNAVLTNPLCFGGSNGSIDVTAGGGTLPYAFAWSNGSPSQDPNGLTSACYTVTVTDMNGCQIVDTFCLSAPPQLQLAFEVTPVACYAGTQGSIDLTVAGGTPGYTFSWSTGETSEDVDSLQAGLYAVTVTDNHGCTKADSVEVETSSPIQLMATVTNVTCPGGANGTIDITVSGGIEPYVYQWSHNVYTEDVLGLAAGTYKLTVTDSVGCKKILSQGVSEPPPIMINPSVTGVSCYEAMDGSIQTNVTGGTGAYNYLWSTADTVSGLNDLAAGIYGLTVTDDTGCTQNIAITVTQPDSLQLNLYVTDAKCFGQPSGNVVAQVVGGTLPCAFHWSTGDTSANLVAGAGVYALTVTDAHGCTISRADIEVLQPPPLLGTADITHVQCHGQGSGAIDITITGGTLPYGTLWSTGDTVEDLTSVFAGAYSATITDDHGCTDTVLPTVTEPPAIVSLLIADSTLCFESSDGSIDVTVSGGVPTYEYLWSDFYTAKDRTDLAAGTYYVTITDDNGCDHVDSAAVFQPQELVVGTSATPDTASQSVGSATAHPSGGTPPYTYVWSDALQQTTQTAGGLPAGNYTVTVTDRNLCTTEATAEVTMVVGIYPSTPSSLILLPNPAHDYVTLYWSGLADAELMILVDGQGRIVKRLGASGTGHVTVSTGDLAPGMYWIQLGAFGRATGAPLVIMH